MGFGVWGLGLYGVGSEICGLRFGSQGVGCGVCGVELSVGFRVELGGGGYVELLGTELGPDTRITHWSRWRVKIFSFSSTA